MLWRDKYELGVSLIDFQHKELFRRVDVFFQTLRSTAPWDQKVEQVNETLAFMKAYVVAHFQDEEAYQLEIGYPGYEAHRQKHLDMVQYVLDFSEQYEKKGCDEQLMLKFAGKLLAWLINHVAAEDQRIATYALSKGGADNGR